ncbi:MAG TPA: prenyltransferase/squalene oxidase repeat-containing protein, partial [Ferruginibacter sp.]|nr:prenyltransferase/squalene oxidase repeat-containing protein [Ferruginibacter sp.]
GTALFFLPTLKSPVIPDLPKDKKHNACVMRTIFNEPQPGVNLKAYAENFRRGKIDSSMNSGKNWLLNAQAPNGGWGAGSHSKQHITDPSKVQQDPASTAMSIMALLRLGEKPKGTANSAAIQKAINFLLQSVEQSPDDALNITSLTGTQPQAKLGQNIDVILTSQCLTSIMHKLNDTDPMYTRIKRAVQKCVNKIQQAQDLSGATKGGGWAPVLQSAFAVNALELAEANDIKVDEAKLKAARNYQKKNFENGDAKTGDAAGVMLYSVSGNARATAKEKRRVKEVLKVAKEQGRIRDDKEVTVENLQKAGLSVNESQELATTYKMNSYANGRAQDKSVLTGFGNNGGEEFVSFLLTGESLIIGGDDEWKKWYENTSTILSNIQNGDGSWRGHHCITSPVFCTATCLLILGIDKDLAQYERISMGKK